MAGEKISVLKFCVYKYGGKIIYSLSDLEWLGICAVSFIVCHGDYDMPLFVRKCLAKNRLLFTRRSLSSMLMEEKIRSKLLSSFDPTYLDVINESSKHNVPKNSETHFKVIIISDRFSNQTLIERHRSINDLLKEELRTGVHALSIIAKTQAQWAQCQENVTKSPPCLGGSAKKTGSRDLT